MSDEPTSPAARDDRDLYCLECGYNLRGLSGDPRRCPECGHLNALGDIELPAALIKRQLRQMEGAPSACVGITATWMVIGVPPAVAYAVDHLFEGGDMDFTALICSTSVTALAIALWFSAMMQFRGYCAGAVGWKRALLLYHLYGLGLAAAVGGPIVGSTLITLSKPGPGEGTPILIGLAIAIAVIAAGGRWVRRKMRTILDPMQREVAVRLAREELRRRLEQGAQWWQLSRKG